MDEGRSGERPVVAVTAAVIRRGGAVLLARRAGGRAQAHLWEFPGGKIEPGETPEDCLARELAEELGIAVEVGAHLLTTRHAYPHVTIELHAYAVRYQGDAFQLTDHDAVAWVPLDELERYPMPEADVPIVVWLQSTQSGFQGGQALPR
ncbi:MAG TPA: (deoxy)nucleoside triphosphate pyrophosphohydrolase [Roseiflexaceae bacterium]|nr:(deoxy)nucleoside triphosphate pyrophosphohydrolase [Roseiflexaceae bacterium]